MWRINLFLRLSIAVVFASALPLRAAPTTAPFDHVSTGSIVIYNIGDLTDGRQDLADAVATTVHNVCGKDVWGGVWAAAALTASPRLLTLKASDDVQETVKKILHKIREAKNLFVSLDYQLVAADVPSDLGEKVTLADPLTTPGFHVTSHIVSNSQVIIPNGQSDTLIDAVALPLPKLIAATTVSADRKTVSIQLTLTDADDGADGAAKPITFSMPFDLSAGVRINTRAGVQWLILKAQPIERHWTPIGITQLIGRD